MVMRAGIFLIAVGVISGLSGCIAIGPPPIAGSGISKEESRPMDVFHAVEASNTLQVVVQVTPGAKPGLKISGDDNIVPLVESISRDGTLILRLKENSNINPKLPLLIEVVTAEIDAVGASGVSGVKVRGSVKVERFAAKASGASEVTVEDLVTKQTVADVSGASRVILTGSSASLKADVSGASEAKAQAFAVEDAEVEISGASGAEVRASKSASGDVSGASHLDLYGSPVRNTVSMSGASQVIEKK
jgi:hypothetical protein